MTSSEHAAMHAGGAAGADPALVTRPNLARRILASLGIETRNLIVVGTLIVADWMSVLGAVFVGWFLRAVVGPQLFSELGPAYPLETYILDLYLLLPWTLAFAAAGLYTRRISFWDEARLLIRACTAAALFAVFLSFAVRPAEELSRLVIGIAWVAMIIALPMSRYSAKRLLTAAGVWGKRIIIVGAGEAGVQIRQRLRGNHMLGYEPVAFVDDDVEKIDRSHLDGLPVRGPLADIPRLVRELAVRDVIVAMPGLAREQLLHVISTCEGHVQSIRVVPDMFGLASVGVEAEDLDGILLLNMRWNLAKPWNTALKRVFDCTLAAIVLLVQIPLMLVTALAIRLDSPGPVLFVQDRLGRGRRYFRCPKFRTMYVDSEERLSVFLRDNPAARKEWELFAKIKTDDPRVTPVGRFLRRFSLDEVPQLWNVLKGEMSLVGPRPYLPSEVPRMGDFVETILKAPPGLTGLWQVTGRSELTFDQRLRLDEYYVRNWSLWMDIILLVKTTTAALRRNNGAY